MMDYKPGDRVACGQLRADASVADQGVVMENLEQSASLMSHDLREFTLIVFVC